MLTFVSLNLRFFFFLFQGAFWGMIVGFIVGAIRMILDFTHLEPRCGEEDTRPSIIAKVHYMYFALILFWITVITIVVISLFTKPMKDANVSKTNASLLILLFFLVRSKSSFSRLCRQLQAFQRLLQVTHRATFVTGWMFSRACW